MSAKRVLVVDDSSFMRCTIIGIITRAGYEVAGEAADGTTAVEQYKILKPDIVTLDITMPKMNGLDALSKIMDFDRTAKVIMCSAMGQQGMVIEAIRSGAKDFIVKPFDADRVLSALNRIP